MTTIINFPGMEKSLFLLFIFSLSLLSPLPSWSEEPAQQEEAIPSPIPPGKPADLKAQPQATESETPPSPTEEIPKAEAEKEEEPTSRVFEIRGEGPEGKFQRKSYSAKEVRQKIESLYERYLEIERELGSIKSVLNKKIIKTTLNVTMIKRGSEKNLLSFLELRFNNNLLYTNFFGEQENRALEKGGRHLLFDGDIPRGRGELSAKAYWKSPDGKIRQVKEETFIVDVFGNTNNFVEVELGEKGTTPLLYIKQLKVTGGQ